MVDTWEAREQVYSLGRSKDPMERVAADALARACGAPAEVRRFLVAAEEWHAAQVVASAAALGSARKEVFSALSLELGRRAVAAEAAALAVWSDALPFVPGVI